MKSCSHRLCILRGYPPFAPAQVVEGRVQAFHVPGWSERAEIAETSVGHLRTLEPQSFSERANGMDDGSADQSQSSIIPTLTRIRPFFLSL